MSTWEEPPVVDEILSADELAPVDEVLPVEEVLPLDELPPVEPLLEVWYVELELPEDISCFALVGPPA